MLADSRHKIEQRLTAAVDVQCSEEMGVGAMGGRCIAELDAS